MCNSRLVQYLNPDLVSTSVVIFFFLTSEAHADLTICLTKHPCECIFYKKDVYSKFPMCVFCMCVCVVYGERQILFSNSRVLKGTKY